MAVLLLWWRLSWGGCVFKCGCVAANVSQGDVCFFCAQVSVCPDAGWKVGGQQGEQARYHLIWKDYLMGHQGDSPLHSCEKAHGHIHTDISHAGSMCDINNMWTTSKLLRITVTLLSMTTTGWLQSPTCLVLQIQADINTTGTVSVFVCLYVCAVTLNVIFIYADLVLLRTLLSTLFFSMEATSVWEANNQVCGVQPLMRQLVCMYKKEKQTYGETFCKLLKTGGVCVGWNWFSLLRVSSSWCVSTVFLCVVFVCAHKCKWDRRKATGLLVNTKIKHYIIACVCRR